MNSFENLGLILATSNPGKVREFQSLLNPLGITIVTPKDIGFAGEVEETGNTFEANALIKARALAAFAVSVGHGDWAVLADDSGLEADALAGAPGVWSARYAGPGDAPPGLPQDVANRFKLLAALAGQVNRAARFRCVLCYLVPRFEPVYFEGVCEGSIGLSEKGADGFGYDPLFIPAGQEKTFGELPASVKDALSHRGRAAAKFLAFLASNSTAE